jgi:hypothetical protein
MYGNFFNLCRSARRQSNIPGDAGVWNAFRIVFN